MKMRQIITTIGLLALLSGAARAISCVNVTIGSAADADEVRKACTVINGDLFFESYLNETISLDGIESILGDVVMNGCDSYDQICHTPEAFSISSSSLTAINGSVYVWYFPGLQEFLLPNLTRVEGYISLKRMNDLKTLDITSLAYLDSFLLEAPNLTTLHHDGLQGFTNKFTPGDVTFWAAAVDSIDSFFKYPIAVSGPTSAAGIQILAASMPNLRNLTIGWTKIPYVSIGGSLPGLAITLGTPNTTTVEIEILDLSGNITALDRAPAVTNLTVDTFSLQSSSLLTSLNLSFDQVSTIDLEFNALKTLQTSPAAVGWMNVSLEIGGSSDLNLSSQYSDSGEQTWYWPQNDMLKIEIYDVNISDAFFNTFISYREARSNSSTAPKVTDLFSIVDQIDSATFNCTPFDSMQQQGLLPSNYMCSNYFPKNAGHVAEGGRWLFALTVIAVVVLCI